MSGRLGNVVTPADALDVLDLLLAGSGRFHELLVTHDDGSRASIWPEADGRCYCARVDCDGCGRERSWLAHYVELIESINGELRVTIPRPKRQWGSCSAFSVLWCRVESKPAAERLRRFKPLPSFVAREGASSRYVALWALKTPLKAWDDIIRANERLSFALGGRRGFANPDNFAFAPPGVVLRAGRKKPCPVLVGRCTLDSYSAREVVGRLRDAPDPEAWRDRVDV